MRQLSKSISEIRLGYDAVVVGSGYGGGIAASRLARMGLQVAVLERGREIATGDFPDRLVEAQQQFQVSSKLLNFGSRQALFDLRLNDDIHVLVGCGLGGGSLINANVSLPPDDRVWKDPVWPKEIADTALQEGFARARHMLRPVPYPNKTPLLKLKALEKSGEKIGTPAVRPPINVTFTRGVNHAGVEQPACTLCGDCCSGCNVGAKNTVQVTYLPDAVAHGADIFTEVRVSHVLPERDKWRVFFELSGHGRDKFGTVLQSVIAGTVVLAAGTLGSTEILLRSRAQGLAVSDRLGQRFSSNGDVLAFAYNNDVPISGIGVGAPPVVETDPVGPTIAGLIDLRGTKNFEDGMVIEEGAIPSGIAPVLPAIMAQGAAIFGKDTDFSLADQASEAARVTQSLLFGAYRGAVRNTQTFLVMAHDDAGGRISLDGDRLKVDWPKLADQPVFKAVESQLSEATAATGGTYTKNPLSSTLLGKNMVTVHPLGGCPIGADSAAGVVDHKCRVFDTAPGRSPQAVHRGLYVCDGSIMPRSLGVNPLLTISALSERAMIHYAADRGLAFDDAPKADAPRLFAGPEGRQEQLPAGVEFTERMAGFVSAAVDQTYETAAETGKAEQRPFSFTLTIQVEDVDTFINDKQHTGRIVGTVDCPALSPEPLDVYGGVFNLMRADVKAVETKRFDYTFALAARDGQEFHFTGYKVVRSDGRADLWGDTTTLFVDIAKGREAEGGPLLRGILKIAPADFGIQIQTLRGLHGKDAADRLRGVAKFGRFFSRELYDTYGGILARTGRYDAINPRKKRALRAPPPEVHLARTRDDKLLRLTRYKGGGKGPVILSHGLGVSSAIFSIDTIETNLVEFLVAAGYDTWLLDYRASIDLAYCRELWTGDEVALNDYPAAVGLVRAVTQAPTVQMVVHCFGATTFSMAMLAGLQGVRSAVISQISTDYVVPFFPQRVLAYLRAPRLFEALGIDAVNARATNVDGFGQRVLDKLLQAIVPVPRSERTHNATSNRISALYGRLYQVEQLNKETMDSGLAEMFGEANIDAFKQLAIFARQQVITDRNGDDVYLPNVKRMAIPITFVHGALNACFKPESTERTLKRLSEANGAELYARHLIPEHGHIDCIFGKNAAIAVYPHILRHLEASATVGA